MQDSSLLGQILLGYAPVVGPGGASGAFQLSLMPAQSWARLDASAVLRLLLQAFPQDRKPEARSELEVLLNVVSESLLADLLGQRPPSHVGLELPAFMTSSLERAEEFRALHAQQVSLVAKGWAVSGLPEPLLPSLRALIADAADAELGIDRPPSHGPRKLDTYIEGVRSIADMGRAFASGAKGVLGLAEDHAVSGDGTLAPDIAVVVELMQLADRKSSFDRMQVLLQSDPALTTTFLRLINSSAFGWRLELPSFAHAFLLLGPGRLMCWLVLLLVWSVPGAQARPLSRMAVRRGLAMSSLAQASGQVDLQDEMFICGMLSLLDKMTGMTFKDLTASIPMSARVQASITGPTGPYSQHLSLLAAVERSSFAEITEMAEGLMLDLHSVNRAVLSALSAVRRLEA